MDDPALAKLTENGLTPAQAYQARVNNQLPSQSQPQSQSQAQVSRTQTRGPGLHGPREQPHSSAVPSSSAAGGSPFQVDFLPSNGKLDLDFGEDDYAIVNAAGDEEESELAYTYDTRECRFYIFFPLFYFLHSGLITLSLLGNGSWLIPVPIF